MVGVVMVMVVGAVVAQHLSAQEGHSFVESEVIHRQGTAAPVIEGCHHNPIHPPPPSIRRTDGGDAFGWAGQTNVSDTPG